ncbi:Ig-like domain repeat protein [Fervidobacterium gondwanense]|uniref:Ig-like domain repeat protein n=1 Tax=Fervidobacterium gondwanense TaxID=44754 RepID=UPI003A7AC625
MKKAVFLTTFVVLLLILTLSGCDTVANLFNKPPVWSSIPDQIVLKGQSVTVDLKQYVSDPDNNLDQIVLKTTGKGSISNGVYTWTPTEVGTYEIEVEAVDKAGAKASKVFKVIVQPSGPVWSSIPDQTILKGQTVTVDLKEYVSDPDNNIEQIVLKTTGKGSISNGVYTWTPTEAGEYDIEVEAIDEAGDKASIVFKVIVQESGTLVVNISQYNSGPVVEGARVEVKDSAGNLRGVGYSDSKGIARVLFRADEEKEYLNVFISKEGHARTSILGMRLLRDQEVELTTTLRKATAAQTATEIPIEVDVKLYTDATKAVEIDPATDITLNSIYVSVVATPVEFGGGINIIYAKVGGVPGTSYFTAPRLYVGAWNELEGSLSVLEFEGEVPLIVDVYDHNDNKVEKIIWLNIVRTPASNVTPYVVQRNTTAYATQYDLYAYTRRQAVQFYSGPKVPENVKGIDASGNAFELAGAPDDDSNLWIEIRWRRWFSTSGATKPKAYRVYRSFDGKSWTPIATLPETYYYYRDTSPLLEVGKKTWYAVSSVYDGFESDKTVIGHITPLPLLNIEVVSPTNGSTNVPRDTVFKWRFTGLEAYVPTDDELSTTSLTYTYSIWLYDYIQNDVAWYSLGLKPSSFYRFTAPDQEVTIKFSDYYIVNRNNSAPYWVDYALQDAYAYDKLQANKTYNWTLRHAWAQKIYNGLSLTDSNLKFKTIAYAIHADDTGVILGPSFVVKPSVFYTFTTGTN